MAAPEPQIAEAPQSDPESYLLDSVFENFDWAAMVRRYPFAALAAAALAGFLVGRSHGPDLIDTVSDSLAERVRRSLDA